MTRPDRYRDYYAVLDVSRDASQDEIKDAWRKKNAIYRSLETRDAKKAATNEYAIEQLKAINHAHDILSNPEKRKQHDMELRREAPVQRQTREGRGGHGEASDDDPAHDGTDSGEDEGEAAARISTVSALLRNERLRLIFGVGIVCVLFIIGCVVISRSIVREYHAWFAPASAPDSTFASALHRAASAVATAPVTAVESPAHLFTSVDANLRAGPSADSTILRTLPSGTRVQPVLISGGWTFVRVGDDSGFVKSELLTPTGASPDSTNDSIVGFVVVAVIFGLIVLYVWEGGRKLPCPKCHQRAGSPSGFKVLNEWVGSEYSWWWSSMRTVTRRHYEQWYKCSRCGHEWAAEQRQVTLR